MPFPAILTISQLPGALAKVTGLGVVAFFLGDGVGGLSGGVVGGIAGMIVAIVGQVLSHMLLMRKALTEGAVTIDQERDKIIDRSNQVHQEEVAFLRRAHQQEMEFMRRQVLYHEQLELVVRRRLHAMVGEVQRCVLHIRLTDAEMLKNSVKPPEFVIKSFQDIVEMYPLPEIPHTSVSETQPPK